VPDQEKNTEKKKERRLMERFAWLGSMMERRKTVSEPIVESEDLGEDLEEIKE